MAQKLSLSLVPCLWGTRQAAAKVIARENNSYPVRKFLLRGLFLELLIHIPTLLSPFFGSLPLGFLLANLFAVLLPRSVGNKKKGACLAFFSFENSLV